MAGRTRHRGAQTSVTLAGPKGLISRSTATDKEGVRTITQSGPGDIVLSRTTILRDIRGATIVQTGPSGGVLTKSLTWTTSNGARSTLIRNGGNQIVADIKQNDHRHRGLGDQRRGAARPGPRPRCRRRSSSRDRRRPTKLRQRAYRRRSPSRRGRQGQVPRVGPPQPINPAPRLVSPPPRATRSSDRVSALASERTLQAASGGSGPRQFRRSWMRSGPTRLRTQPIRSGPRSR